MRLDDGSISDARRGRRFVVICICMPNASPDAAAQLFALEPTLLLISDEQAKTCTMISLIVDNDSSASLAFSVHVAVFERTEALAEPVLESDVVRMRMRIASDVAAIRRARHREEQG